MFSPDPWPAIAFLHANIRAENNIAAMPAPLREATVFAGVLAQIPIGRIDDEPLLGDYGMAFAGDVLREQVAACQAASPGPESDPTDPWGCLNRNFVCRTTFTPAHTMPDYETVLRIGLDGIIERLETPGTAGNVYHQAMIVALRGVADWADRFAALGNDPACAICRCVPRRPAQDFAQAVQALWLLHTAVGISEMSDSSLSLGRVDQYLYPFYRKDRERGVSDEALEQVLEGLFLKLNHYGDAACTVNLGGADPDGNDRFNDLTRLIVRVATRMQKPSPILAVRVHEGLAEPDLDALLDPRLLRIGQPSFYGEIPCRRALERRGVPSSETHRWAANSCMGLIMPGEEFSDMWGVVITFLLPLELALNGGRPFREELPFPLTTPCPESYAGIDDIVEAVLAFARELLERLATRHRRLTEDRGKDRPNPYLSALLRDCVERGRDRLLGGVRYHTANVDAFGLVNAADALTALDQVVFRERRWTLEEVATALRNDFAGAEWLRQALLAAPKYGNGDPVADAMVRRVGQGFADIVRELSDERIIYMPSFHTLTAHVGAGATYGASADGRRSGEPLAKNVGPMAGRNVRGLTGLLTSAAFVGQETFFGGQALDVSLDAQRMENDTERRAFKAALQTYFEQGGLQVQVNGLTAQCLRDAIREPETHQNLTVRIAGYSARFVTLPDSVQLEMAERFEHGV